jgi:hypothetical protein
MLFVLSALLSDRWLEGGVSDTSYCARQEVFRHIGRDPGPTLIRPRTPIAHLGVGSMSKSGWSEATPALVDPFPVFGAPSMSGRITLDSPTSRWPSDGLTFRAKLDV